MFQVNYPNEMRATLFNLIRRVEGAYHEYEQGRANLNEYVGKRGVTAVYIKALANFEQCIAALYQAAMFMRQIVPNKRLSTAMTTRS